MDAKPTHRKTPDLALDRKGGDRACQTDGRAWIIGVWLSPSDRCSGKGKSVLRAWAKRRIPVKKGKEMTSLRQKVLVVVSAIVVTLALMVLPGCKKAETPKKAPTKKAPATGME
jgi:hypothetical protein